jgi:hypothetical protein
MTPRVETADPSEMLEGAFQRLQGTPGRVLPVVRDGQLVGLLTLENVGEFLMIQSALRSGDGSQTASSRLRPATQRTRRL